MRERVYAFRYLQRSDNVSPFRGLFPLHQATCFLWFITWVKILPCSFIPGKTCWILVPLFAAAWQGRPWGASSRVGKEALAGGKSTRQGFTPPGLAACWSFSHYGCWIFSVSLFSIELSLSHRTFPSRMGWHKCPPARLCCTAALEGPAARQWLQMHCPCVADERINNIWQRLNAAQTPPQWARDRSPCKIKETFCPNLF